MNKKITQRALLVALFAMSSLISSAAKVSGFIRDKSTNEPLIGATIIVENTTTGSVAGIDGDFLLDLPNEPCKLVISYLSYETQQIEIDVKRGLDPITIELEAGGLAVDEVKVMGRKNLEGESALQQERIISTFAIENLGANEMSQKGISNAEEGVKKMTGISVAGAGQIIVRGLGDRYSTTTLNGQPIASPNPDNKLIPLDVFPSSTIQNVTVNKVYTALHYADYSGAHIDISTKTQGSKDFFTVGLSVGADAATIGKDFYQMDNVSLFSHSSLGHLSTMKKQDAQSYIKNNGDAFDTDFSTSSITSLPDFGVNFGWGDTFKIGEQKLSVLASAAMGKDNIASIGNFEKTIQADGKVSDDYLYDSFQSSLKLSALASLGLTLRESDRIGYTLFYARNATNELQNRSGVDFDLNRTVANISVSHIYKMFTHQLYGKHDFGNNWEVDWSGAYTTSASNEPDRRQVMFAYDTNRDLHLFTDKANVVMRYFGDLEEDEVNGDIRSNYKFASDDKLTFGASYKNKKRDVNSTRFYYNVNALSGQTFELSDLYNTNSFLNFENIQNGTISVTRDQQDKDQYNASQEVLSAFASLDITASEAWLINLGVRYEQSVQTVNYNNGKDSRSLEANDIFPTVNVKYSISDKKQIRGALSKTITRPQFIEMAPFEYRQSYGSATIVGNANLMNGYNYNADVRYETFFDDNQMFSITGYFKYLESPIERTQYAQGGGTINSFQNAEQGVAGGAELEFRKNLAEDLKLNLNVSYMYTNVSLSETGNYTNKSRALQGASPYLVNVDLTYAPKLRNDKDLNFALLYNLQGPRIYSVGVRGCGDVVQQSYSKLNFVTSYAVSELVSLKLQLDNLLFQDEVFEQEIPTLDRVEVVGRKELSLGCSVGVSLSF